MKISVLQEARYGYKPKLPTILTSGACKLVPVFGEKTHSAGDSEAIASL
ncbi:MAG: hypothetical protein GX911_02525, partial [Spirochaetales bacterium]|nr:hypothetical protein [Spirochaetales bacterium]